MFLRDEYAAAGAGGTSARTFGRAAVVAAPEAPWQRWRRDAEGWDVAPDLGAQIGSADWWRGLATCTGLCALGWALAPSLHQPIHVAAPVPAGEDFAVETRSLSFGAAALGGASGTRTSPVEAMVRPLADTPERPILEATATLDAGGLAAALQRSGVGAAEAVRAEAAIASRVSPADLATGTRLDITLGRRDHRAQARPLERLAFRARFDLALELVRGSGGLALRATPIAIDSTPLRVRGQVGAGLYRAARAAGAPAKVVEAFIRSIAARVPMGLVGSDDRFDLVVEQQRAATGEVKLGRLMYAGLEQGGRATRLVRWDEGGRTRWLDPQGIGERRAGMAMPVPGRISSGFGWRVHPVLGFRRLHKGMDFAAGHGTPIRAASSGQVAMAGRHGGYGNFVKLSHGGGIATGYGHMSRIAVAPGQHVAQGQVIGYVGSTGLSTGPHLHYELWKNGVPVNPRSVTMASTDELSGEELRRFKALAARLMAVPSGG